MVGWVEGRGRVEEIRVEEGSLGTWDEITQKGVR